MSKESDSIAHSADATKSARSDGRAEPEPEALISELRNIRVDIHEGRGAPYKYIVLLWAIAQALTKGDRRFGFEDVRSELAAALRPFQLASSRPDPRNPWFALKETPQWWDLVLPNTAGLTYKQTLELNLEGGLSLGAFNLVIGDDNFASHAVQVIVDIIGDSPEVRALLAALELDRIDV